MATSRGMPPPWANRYRIASSQLVRQGRCRRSRPPGQRVTELPQRFGLRRLDGTEVETAVGLRQCLEQVRLALAAPTTDDAEPPQAPAGPRHETG